MEINVVDVIMGGGKTSAAKNYIKESSNDKKFMYVTPYIDEVEKLIKECPTKNFKQPRQYNEKMSKMVDLKKLLNNGENIATTHVLFHLFDDEVIDLCYSQGYILIMDEVTDVIEPHPMDKKDLQMLLEHCVKVKENGILQWIDDTEYSGKFEDEKRLCEMECLALYGSSVMMWLFPVKVFNAFRESYILTYMFNAQMQRYYYDFYGMKYNHLYVAGNTVETYRFTTEPILYKQKYNYKNLITILDDKKLNMIGDAESALSKTWYMRNKDNVLIKQLKDNTLNFFCNKLTVYDEETGKWKKSKSNSNIWTTFKDYKNLISGKGYAKGYLPSNMRATNSYKSCSVVAYLVNKYFNPFVKTFFTGQGIEVCENDYAISEMLQFIWRSAIREGKHITVYIPSKRMRELLIKWINEQNYSSEGNSVN